jgi:D-alanine-D-alanine ligase
MPTAAKSRSKSDKASKKHEAEGQIKKSTKNGGSKHADKKQSAKQLSQLYVDKKALKKLKLVAVAYSYVERDMFPTEDAYIAEVEVEDRAKQVIAELEKLGIPAKGYPANQYFVTNLLVDDPNLVLNLVDTLRGKDALQTTVPAALELANIPYTGAGMQGLVIGNNRHLTKQLLTAFEIPTPEFQFIQRAGTNINQDLGLPLIVKLNESGGSVGINNDAVQESYESAQKKVDDMISTYKIPVIVERFIDGKEINVVVIDDGRKKHVFLAEKIFRQSTDGKHFFTSLETYNDPKAWTYKRVEEPLASQITKYAQRAFTGLNYKDYAKFDVRVEDKTGTPYFSDCNPNTAFGPDEGIPLTDIAELYGISFQNMLASLVSKNARKIK